MINDNTVISACTDLSIETVKRDALAIFANGEYFLLETSNPSIIKTIVGLANKKIAVCSIIKSLSEYDSTNIQSIISELIDYSILIIHNNSDYDANTNYRNIFQIDSSFRNDSFIDTNTKIIVFGSNILAHKLTNELKSYNFSFIDKVDVNSSSAEIETYIRSNDIVFNCYGGMVNKLVEEINYICFTNETPCINGNLNLSEISIGPVVVSDKTPCYECYLRDRFAMIGDYKLFRTLSEATISNPQDINRLNAATSYCANLMLNEAMSLTKYNGLLQSSSLLSVDMHSMRVTQRDLHRDHSCSVCSNCGHIASAKNVVVPNNLSLILDSGHSLDDEGGLRSVKKEDAMEVITNAINNGVTDICNILPIDQYDRIGVPVYLAKRKDGRNSWGKGFTREQALLSAGFESIERCSSNYVGKTKTIRAKYRLIKEHAIDMDNLLGIPHNGGYDGFFNPFSNDRKIDWVWGWSLTFDKPTLVPAQMVFLKYDISGELPFIRYTSNGLAAGVSLEDAILQALMETVERDAEITTIKTGITPQRIDINSIEDECCISIFNKCKEAAIECFVSNLTNDAGISSLCTTLHEKAHPWFYATTGYGTHLNPEIALRRSFTEALQKRAVAHYFWHVTSNASDKSYFLKNSYQSVNSAKYSKHVYNLMGDPNNIVSFDMLTNLSTSNVASDIKKTTNHLMKNIPNINIVVVNLTHPNINIPVVRVLVEGLQVYDIIPQYIHPRTLTIPHKLHMSQNDLKVEDLYYGGFAH